MPVLPIPPAPVPPAPIPPAVPKPLLPNPLLEPKPLVPKPDDEPPSPPEPPVPPKLDPVEPVLLLFCWANADVGRSDRESNSVQESWCRRMAVTFGKIRRTGGGENGLRRVALIVSAISARVNQCFSGLRGFCHSPALVAASGISARDCNRASIASSVMKSDSACNRN